MSGSDERKERLLDVVLAATPERVIAVVDAPNPEEQAELDANREAVALLAHTLAPIAPSPSVREKLARALGLPEHQPRTAKRALLVVDMIVDYLTPGLPLHVPRAVHIIEPLRERIARARTEGVPVFYLFDTHHPDDPEVNSAWPAHAVQGTGGDSVIPELAPEPSDIVLGHRTYSCFWETTLEQQLRSKGVDTLELTGCATEVGLLATATDALMRGFRVELPAATQAGTSEIAEYVARGILTVLRPVQAWSPPSPR